MLDGKNAEDRLIKVGPFLLLLAVGPCPAQFLQGGCCALGPTPSQVDWSLWAFESLPSRSGASDQASGESISAARLRHKPPHKAINPFLRGIKLTTAGDYQGAASEFEKAIAFDPDFSEAHGNLAVEYTWLGRFEDSIPEFQRALVLDPATSYHHANFAYALVRLNRYVEAEAEAQTAVGLDPSDAEAQFLLGCLMARRPETRNLCESHLRYAARSVPEAHLALAQVYSAQGSSEVANVELERYRQSTALRRQQSPALGFLLRQ